MNQQKRKAEDALRTRSTELKNVIVPGLKDIVHECEAKDLISTTVRDNLLSESIQKSEDDRAYSLLSNIRRSLSYNTTERIDAFLCILYEHGKPNGPILTEEIAKEYGYPLEKFEKLSKQMCSSTTNGASVQTSDLVVSKPKKADLHEDDLSDQLAEDGSPVYTYPINCKAGDHGVALIIANEEWKDNEGKKREGTAADVVKITKTLQGMKYKVIEEKNLKADDMKKVFEYLSKNIASSPPNRPDSFICFILSHGSGMGIEGVDEKYVSIHDLAMAITSDKCDALKGKPKMFFIQACRGTDLPEEVRLDGNYKYPVKHDEIVLDGNISAIPPGADFFFGYSTITNNAALREVQSGSLYIRVICEVFEKHAGKLHLHDMMMVVHKKLATDEKYKYVHDKGTYRQMPETVSTLMGNVYFK